MSFSPSMFIAVGETAAFFTLRERYLSERWVGGKDGFMSKTIAHSHVQNLAQDAEEALAKAQAIAESTGVPLEITDVSVLDKMMREIHRADAAERQRRLEARQAQETEWAQLRVAQDQAKRELISKGVIPFGQHRGLKFAEAPRGYITWLIKSIADFEAGSLMLMLAEAVRDTCSHLVLPDPHPSLMLGGLKERLLLDVIITKVRSFERPVFGSYIGAMERVWVTTMVDKVSGACVVSRAPKFMGEEGAELRIKGTVVKHDDYKGQAQTLVQRVMIQ